MASLNTPTCDRCAKPFPGSISVSYKGGVYCEQCFRLQLYRAAPKTPDDALPADGFVDSGVTLDSLRRQGYRGECTVRGRQVALFSTRDGKEVFACDNLCYHAGGPLSHGDIEDSCDPRFGVFVRCPWHGYRISLKTGEGLSAVQEAGFESKGVRQRIHQVEIRKPDRIFVKISDVTQTVASDVYYPIEN